MLFTIIGSPGVGKGELANYLKEHHGFQVIDIRENFYRSLPVDKNPTTKESAIKLFYSEKYSEDVYKLFEKAFYSTFATWDHRVVIYPITTLKQIELLRARKFVYILGMTAPTSARYNNFKKKYNETLSFGEFIDFDDSINFGISTGAEITEGIKHADHIISNNSTIEDLMQRLDKTDFTNSVVLRPKLDYYFMQIAVLVSKRSNCFRRAVGAVVVKKGCIISTGYNGAPFGVVNCNQGGCPRCVGAKVVGKDLDKCICIHAEENAIIEAGRAKSVGATIYTTTFPCMMCAKFLVQAGIKRVVYFKEYNMGLPYQLFTKAYVDIEQLTPFIVAPYIKL